nr:cyanophycin synthetase [Candidatus Woesebacteria bacterium]
KRMGLSLKSVIAEGNAIQLLDNANLSSGGEGDDVTHILHSDYQTVAIKLARDMGLTFCGVDIMTPNPIDKMVNKYCVIELNAAPGLDYYAEGGEVQKGVVKNLYRKMLTHMIRA